MDAVDPLASLSTLWRRCRPSGAAADPLAPLPTLWRRCRPSGAAADPLAPLSTLYGRCRFPRTLPTSARLSRCRHGSPVVGTALPSSARLSRPRHTFPVITTAFQAISWLHGNVENHLPTFGRPLTNPGRHGTPNKATALTMSPDAYQCSRTFSYHLGRSPTIQDVLQLSRTFS